MKLDCNGISFAHVLEHRICEVKGKSMNLLDCTPEGLDLKGNFHSAFL